MVWRSSAIFIGHQPAAMQAQNQYRLLKCNDCAGCIRFETGTLVKPKLFVLVQHIKW